VVRGMPPFGDLSVREAEVGLINSGGFRLDRNIQKNEGISKKTLCDIFFHPNSVLLFQLKGAELLEVLRKSLSLIKNSREGDGNFLQIGGIKMNAKDLEIKKVGLVSLHGSYEPLNMERDYTVATTYYVARKCGEYKQWFDGKEGMIRADDIKSAVEMALRQLQDFGEIEVSLISGEKPEQLNYFEAYLALNNEPRWLLT
jgi:2',3'-cyclic-nucleotide 2'-phosphodiesterase (5'-nucleotidase family)